jgi:Zn-dependent protease
MTCAQCGAALAPELLVCPACHALVHAPELKTLAAAAEQANAAGDYSEALAQWRRALELLPPQSTQHAAVRSKVEQLSRQVDSPGAQVKQPEKPKWARGGGALGALGLILWEFKFLAIFFLTKAKLLLLGLTKASTFLSMILSLGVYWSLWGWKFALGLVLSIYVHEMGHVVMLRHYGIRATAPMFIPGIGAFIRAKQYPASNHEDARVGLAGPVWGLGAAMASYVLYLATGLGIFGAIAKFGAWMNLFNLLPIFPLDGGRGFKALSKPERMGIAGLMLVSWFISHEGLLLLLAAVAGFRAFAKEAPKQRDMQIFIQFAFLVVTLTLLSTLHFETGASQPLLQ